MSHEHAATFRFYEELNDFLPPESPRREHLYRFEGHPSVKNAIESQGVPHTEVDLILIDGRSVGFDYQLRDGDRVSCAPWQVAITDKGGETYFNHRGCSDTHLTIPQMTTSPASQRNAPANRRCEFSWKVSVYFAMKRPCPIDLTAPLPCLARMLVIIERMVPSVFPNRVAASTMVQPRLRVSSFISFSVSLRRLPRAFFLTGVFLAATFFLAGDLRPLPANFDGAFFFAALFFAAADLPRNFDAFSFAVAI